MDAPVPCLYGPARQHYQIPALYSPLFQQASGSLLKERNMPTKSWLQGLRTYFQVDISRSLPNIVVSMPAEDDAETDSDPVTPVAEKSQPQEDTFVEAGSLRIVLIPSPSCSRSQAMAVRWRTRISASRLLTR